MSRLPLELYELILPSLREDRDTLKSLSTSWRVFTPLSQRHLFAHVIIQPPWQCVREYHNVSGAASAFRQLLDGSPHIGEYVKSLEVCCRSYSFETCDEHQTQGDPNDWIDHDDDLPSCLTRLSRLQALVMDQFPTFNGVPKILLDAIYEVLRLPSLIHLDLGDAPVLSIVQQSHRKLKHLVVRNHCRNTSLETKSEVPEYDDLVQLDSLCLEGWCDIVEVEEALADPKNRISLRKLRKLVATVPDRGKEVFEALGRLLRLCERSLEEFRLMWPYAPGGEIDHMFYLSRLPSLRLFHIYLASSTDPGDEGIDDQLPWFIDFLEHSVTTATHPLEELSIEQYIHCEDDEIQEHFSDTADGWGKVAHILLNSGHFPRLKAFKLRILSYDKPGLATGAVQFLETRDPFKQLKSEIDSVVIFPPARDFQSNMADFVEDHTWLSIEERHTMKQSQIPAT